MYARAVENHVFIITTNRTGKDENKGKSVTFTGNSIILNPKGDYLAEADKEKEELKIIEINPADALDKMINPYNNVIEDRRDGFYFN